MRVDADVSRSLRNDDCIGDDEYGFEQERRLLRPNWVHGDVFQST